MTRWQRNAISAIVLIAAAVQIWGTFTLGGVWWSLVPAIFSVAGSIALVIDGFFDERRSRVADPDDGAGEDTGG